MKKNNKWVILFYFSLLASASYSQSPIVKSYVIITCEEKFAKSFEGIKRTFWIADEDSIFDTGTKFFPLLLSGYFKNDLDSCCLGKEIDPYYSSHEKENYLDTAQEKSLDILQTIIFAKRKKMQTIIKKWAYGNQAKVTIYATSIFGSFCFSKFNFIGKKRSDYADLLYLPNSKIEENNRFWETLKSKRFMQLDFSRYNFNYYILYNEFPEWRKYGK